MWMTALIWHLNKLSLYTTKSNQLLITLIYYFRPSPLVAHAELRNSAIHLLLSMLPLPLHFFNLPIKGI